jgi:hypothetical protein
MIFHLSNRIYIYAPKQQDHDPKKLEITKSFEQNALQTTGEDFFLLSGKERCYRTNKNNKIIQCTVTSNEETLIKHNAMDFIRNAGGDKV